MRLDRSLIGRSVRFTEISGDTFDHGRFLQCIDQWKAVLALRVEAGERVAIFSATSASSLALAFALWELGISYFSGEVRARVIQRAISLKVKYLFVDDALLSEAIAEADGKLEIVRLPGTAEMLGNKQPVGSIFRPHPTGEALIGFTSGSVGEPKFVSHTYESLYVPSDFMAENFYSASDEVLIYVNLNHLGFVSCILLAAMRAGAGLHLLPSAKPAHVAPAIARGKINTCPLFPYNWYHIESDYPGISLAHIEKVITGGSLISQDFCQSLFAKGARKVLNVYGLTEALPPVSIKEITPDSISSYSGVSVGRLAPYVEVKIQEGEIYLRGSNQGKISDHASIDGFVPTGDWGDLIEGELHIFSRKKSILQAGGLEITSDDVLCFVLGLELEGKKIEDWIGRGRSEMILAGNLLYLILERASALPLDLAWLNSALQSGLRPELKIEAILYFEELPFNGLKVDRERIRAQLARISAPLAVSTPIPNGLPEKPDFLCWQFGDTSEYHPIVAGSMNLRLWLELGSLQQPGSFREEMEAAVRRLNEQRAGRTVALCHSGGAHSEALAHCLEQFQIPYEAYFLDIYSLNTGAAEEWLAKFERRSGKSVRRVKLSREHFLHRHAPLQVAEFGCDQPNALALTYLFEQIPEKMFLLAGGGNFIRSGSLATKIAEESKVSGTCLITPYSQIVHYLWANRRKRAGEFYFYSASPGLMAATLRDPNFSRRGPFTDSAQVLYTHFPEIEPRPRRNNWDSKAAERENVFVRSWLASQMRNQPGMEFWRPAIGAMLNVEPLLGGK